MRVRKAAFGNKYRIRTFTDMLFLWINIRGVRMCKPGHWDALTEHLPRMLISEQYLNSQTNPWYCKLTSGDGIFRLGSVFSFCILRLVCNWEMPELKITNQHAINYCLYHFDNDGFLFLKISRPQFRAASSLALGLKMQ